MNHVDVLRVRYTISSSAATFMKSFPSCETRLASPDVRHSCIERFESCMLSSVVISSVLFGSHKKCRAVSGADG
jgi:hypothetical protein